MARELDDDINIIRQIRAVPTILEVICKTTGMGFAAVARVTRDKWIACEVLDTIDFGLKSGGELKLETTICDEIRESGRAVIIDHVADDATYCGHPTPAMYGFQSYISMPIILADGSFFGTLCAIDPRPARVSSTEIVGMFKLFAELIAVHVDARARLLDSQNNLASERDKLAISQGRLLDERNASELREQFIAVLGHDLRNPLASINAGVHLLSHLPQVDRGKTILTMMLASVQRMSGLIDNVLDFARGRLGGGLALDNSTFQLEPMFRQVVDEIRLAFPDRTLETSFDLDVPFVGDKGRMAQLFSNLLGNAVTHGSDDTPIRIEASNGPDGLKLAVSNGGDPIPETALVRLFQPFYRGEVRSSLQGLGLGLFIASEIASQHGGKLGVSSTPEETRFTLTVPPAGG